VTPREGIHSFESFMKCAELKERLEVETQHGELCRFMAKHQTHNTSGFDQKDVGRVIMLLMIA